MANGKSPVSSASDDASRTGRSIGQRAWAALRWPNRPAPDRASANAAFPADSAGQIPAAGQSRTDDRFDCRDSAHFDNLGQLATRGYFHADFAWDASSPHEMAPMEAAFDRFGPR